MFTQNEGKLDRILRVIIGTSLVIYSIVFLNDNYMTLISLLGILILSTGLIGWCGLYTIFGINTCHIKSIKNKKKK